MTTNSMYIRMAAVIVFLSLAVFRLGEAGQQRIGDFPVESPALFSSQGKQADNDEWTDDSAFDEAEPYSDVQLSGMGVAMADFVSYDIPDAGVKGNGALPPLVPFTPAPKAPAAPYVPPGPPPADHQYVASSECLPDVAPPTPEAVDNYRMKLEARLLERYNNLPETAGRVAKVSIVLSKPLDYSLDGKYVRAEFDQLVYDSWGKRMPALEKEYYVITFGAGGVEQVRADPSIRVGLDLEKAYSERAPLTADPFRNVEPMETFKRTPALPMPKWWRPEFPELD